MKKYLAFLFATIMLFSCATDDINTVTNSGTNGSYSRMVIVSNYMYQVNSEELTTYDIADPENIIEKDRQTVGFFIESIFHMEGILFIGSGEALHIFEINDEGIPNRKSKTDYASFSEEQTPCDPVISDGDFAYVTLSSVTDPNDPCARPILLNELRIYNIANLSDPILVNTISMINPKGLAYDNDLLFVCENQRGLKVFDKSDVTNLQLIHHFEGIHTYDVIARYGLLIVIGQGAIHQYDYTSVEDMHLVSTLNL